MKVSELITVLKTFDQELPVFYAVDIHDGWYRLLPQGIRKEYLENDSGDTMNICLIGEAQ